VLELGRVGDVKALEQITPIKLESFRFTPASQRFLECDRVTPHFSRREAKPVTVVVYDSGFADRATENVDSLTQRVTGVFAIEVRPEHRQQGIATMLAAG
jgi:hypothetical protein